MPHITLGALFEVLHFTCRDSAHWCKHLRTSVCSTEFAKYESPAKYPLNSCRYRFSEPERNLNFNLRRRRLFVAEKFSAAICIYTNYFKEWTNWKKTLFLYWFFIWRFSGLKYISETWNFIAHICHASKKSRVFSNIIHFKNN